MAIEAIECQGQRKKLKGGKMLYQLIDAELDPLHDSLDPLGSLPCTRTEKLPPVPWNW